MKQYKMFELTFGGAEPDGSQAVVDLQAEFTCGQDVVSVKGFYAGEGNYIVRFLPLKEGHYTWKVSGVVNATGEEECEKVENSHNMVKAVDTHFEYEDGTLFRPFGTTIYAMFYQPQERIEQTFSTLKSSPFNKVRHCAFPKYYSYNKEDPEMYPFEKDEDGNWDVDHPCFAFWNHLENGILELAKAGIQSDLILFHPYDEGHWGFDQMTRKQNLTYLDYLLRRFAAIPEVWWSMANEYDLCFSKTLDDWYAIEEFIVANDPYHHLLSNHNCFAFYDFSRPNITHCSIQTIQVEKAGAWIKQYNKPLIYDECCYEGNLPLSWGNISGFEMASRFWCTFVQGAYCTHGEVFLSEDDVLWWSKGGILKGESPKRIGFLKSILEEIPGSIQTWEIDRLAGLPEDVKKKIEEGSFTKLYMSLTQERKDLEVLKAGDYLGHCGESVYIQYFAHNCAGITEFKLPEDKKYQIEIIDILNMTREILVKEGSGSIQLPLPGKEGIAVLAKVI